MPIPSGPYWVRRKRRSRNRMPLYEYTCDCGAQFEAIRSIADRHGAACPCGGTAKLKVSHWGRVIVAGYDTVVGHDGTVLSRKQTTEQTPMLPEKVHGSRF